MNCHKLIFIEDMQQQPLKIRIRPSLMLSLFLLLLHLSALICVSLLSLVWWLKLLISAFVIASLIQTMRRYVWLRERNSIIEIWQESDGTWVLKNRKGQIWQATLRENSIVTNFLIILNFISKDKKKKKISVLIFYDILPPKEFRQLRVRLRFNR